MGFYAPGPDEPGLQLSLLIDGIDYPGVQVYGRNFVYIDPLDTIYASSFTDQYLGLRPTDINVDGGKFVDIYEGHAPEELVNGSEYDTLDLRVYTRPGSDWDLNGHGFDFNSVRYTVDADITTDYYSWANLVQRPAQVLVSDVTTGRDLTPGVDFTIDWVNKTVVITNIDLIGTVINITAYEVGGGSQLYRAYYTGAQAGSSVIIPVAAAEISQVAVFVDGEAVDSQTWEPYAPHTVWSVVNTYQFRDIVTSDNVYYRALKDVPVGVDINNVAYWLSFVPSQFSTLYFNATYPDDSGIAIVALGDPTIYEGTQPYDTTRFDTGDTTGYPGSFDFSVPINPNPYSWSTPQVQYIVSDGSQTLTLTNNIEGTNPANLIVTRNGLRLFPAAGIEWHGDSSTTSFGLPQRMGVSFSQSIINAATDISVWVNSVLQTQGVDYTVTAWTGSNTPGRQVVFAEPPGDGQIILISVSTIADYQVVPGDPNTIELSTPPNEGDIFAVTTWNDTQQQDICTLVFVGPENNGTEIIVNQPYDSTLFSSGLVNDEPGSFDYTEGQFIPANNFYLDRPGVTANRLWVTLDGYRLFEGIDFTVENDYLILSSGTITSIQKLVVTEFAESTVPDAIAFRIFQDMRGVQATYRITDSTTTELAEDLTADADTIYVVDASHLSEPNMEAGIFGVITIDGERIMYRERDLANNTVSSLLRGTAGTAAADHTAGTPVYEMGRNNLMPIDQNYIQQSTTVADGMTDTFTADNIAFNSLGGDPLVPDTGTRQYDNFTVEESMDGGTSVVLDYVPDAGIEVTILVRRGTWWYDLSTTYTRTLALQETNTPAARFLRGL
jgi:hypothetical protein